MEKYFLSGVVLFLLLILNSCGNGDAYLNVIEGNYAFSRGEYQEANYKYLEVKDGGKYDDYISYNLGNVYYALGEINSAFKSWEEKSDIESEAIKIRKLFNRGVLLYELSRYEEAYRVFRNILEIDPSYVAAKIDLEYCIQKMSFTSENSVSSGQNASVDRSHENEDVSRILNFVKRKETNVWMKPESTRNNGSVIEDW